MKSLKNTLLTTYNKKKRCYTMCLINFQFHNHPHYKLIVAANRDEAYNRPTQTAHYWEDEPDILAGRDLLQMGTWLGMTQGGRFAALTNFRDSKQTNVNKKSRGEIVRDYLVARVSPEEFLLTLQKNKDSYTGFNVILGNQDDLYYYNNVQDKITHIPKGTHGLSNHMLNTPWPKVTKGKHMLGQYVSAHEKVCPDKIFDILSDREEANDEKLPETGIGLELERQLSPQFIKTPEYGTKSSTVVLIDKTNHVTFVERTYVEGLFGGEKHFEFQI